MSPYYKACAWLLSCLLVSVISCRKMEQPTGAVPDPPYVPGLPADQKIVCSISGQITDASGKPVEGAKVLAGNSFTTTDITGNFLLQNILVTRGRAFVKIEKDGYFQGSRTFIAQPEATHHIAVTLIRKEITDIFSASSGRSVLLNTGGQIIFQPNSIRNATTGISYTGMVTVYASELRADDPKLSSIMPGDLRGITKDNQEKILQTYGMMAVEIRGSNNEKLQLDPLKPASIKIPALSGPPSMPLWYFNDSTGLWKEEGSATSSGGYYSGTVTHFSYWNWDMPYEGVSCQIKVLNSDGTPAPNKYISIFDSVLNRTFSGFTNSAGIITGTISMNVRLQVRMGTYCGFTSTHYIGPFLFSPTLNVITLPPPPYITSNVSITVNDCYGQPVTSGYLSIPGTVQGFFSFTNGIFSGPIQHCGPLNSLTVTAIDNVRQLSGIKNGISPSTNVITACTDLAQSYFAYTISGIGSDSIRGCFSNFVPNTARGMAISPLSEVSFTIFTTPSSAGPFFPPYIFSNPVIDSIQIIRGGETYKLLTAYPVGWAVTSNFVGGAELHTLKIPGPGMWRADGIVMNQSGQTFLLTYSFKTYRL